MRAEKTVLFLYAFIALETHKTYTTNTLSCTMRKGIFDGKYQQKHREGGNHKVKAYPERCKKSIDILMRKLKTDSETAYTMMMLTAALMGLHTEDMKVVEMILKDCGYVEEM